MIPIVVEKVLTEHFQSLEKANTRPSASAGLLPQFAHEVACGMESKRQQIQLYQDIGQSTLPVSEVVLQVITFVFQDVKGFVFDFPATASRRDQGHHVVSVQFDRSDEVVVVGDLFTIQHLQRHPVDVQRIGAIVQRQIVHPPIAVKDFAVLFIFEVAGDLLGFDAIKVFIQQPMRRSLRSENQIRVGELFDEFAGRLSGIQIIAQIDGAVEPVEFLAVRIQPAFDCFGFTVLFFVAVLRGNELRYQRYSHIVSGATMAGTAME